MVQLHNSKTDLLLTLFQLWKNDIERHREKIVSNALEFSEAVNKNSKVQIILMNDKD